MYTVYVQWKYAVSCHRKVSQNVFHHSSNKRWPEFIKSGKQIRLPKLIRVIDNDPPGLIILLTTLEILLLPITNFGQSIKISAMLIFIVSCITNVIKCCVSGELIECWATLIVQCNIKQSDFRSLINTSHHIPMKLFKVQQKLQAPNLALNGLSTKHWLKNTGYAWFSFCKKVLVPHCALTTRPRLHDVSYCWCCYLTQCNCRTFSKYASRCSINRGHDDVDDY